MNEQLIYLIAAEPSENTSISKYFRSHNFNCRVFDGLEAAESGVAGQAPDVVILAGSTIPTPEICRFGAFVEQICIAPIIALLTPLQAPIISEIAESDNIRVTEYPITLREIRAAVDEALQEIAE